jgi:hypothetical protein
MSIDDQWRWLTRAQVLSSWVDEKQTDNPVGMKGKRLEVFVLAEYTKICFPAEDG